MNYDPIFGQVYFHYNPISGRGYVGQTTQGMEKRWKEHVKHSRYPKRETYNTSFARAIRKHGSQAFESQVLSVARTKAELDNLEKIWIILLQTRENGYNITAGGEGLLGLKHTDEAKAKMSAASRGNKYCVGRVCSPESREKQSRAVKGRVLSVEWKEKIAASGRGRTHSEETKAKISKGNQGKVYSAESRAKMSESAKGNTRCLGRTFSSETLAKMSASQKARHARERAEKSNG